ncbi:hypothetical protein SDC9_175228 [bioreactor metagenome]|uniref:Uncharacterized protein n=1 Tax=bioreactor metagenome TaxID=1076179 RepID=A0A645GUT6_9ZZZZ
MTAVAFDDQVPLYRLHPEMGHPIDTIIDGPLAPPNVPISMIRCSLVATTTSTRLSDTCRMEKRERVRCWS